MAFKMKGFEPGNKKKLSIKIGKATPLKKNIFKRAGQWLKDKTINMSNVTGDSPEVKRMREADAKRTARERKKLQDIRAQQDRDRQTKTDAYIQWKKDNPKAGSDAHKLATAHAEKTLADKKAATKKKSLAMTPKTKEQSEKKGILAQNITKSKKAPTKPKVSKKAPTKPKMSKPSIKKAITKGSREGLAELVTKKK